MTLLAADWTPYIKLIGVILVVGFSAMSQLIAQVRKAAAKNAQVPPVPRPNAPGAPRNTQQQLHDEVEEFLRRAAQNKTSPSTAAAPAPPPRPRPSLEPQAPASPMFPMGKVPGQSQPSPTRRRKKQQPPPPPVTAPVQAEAPLSQRHMTTRIEDHISTRNLEKRVGSLASHEQEFGVEVGDAFSRQVGSLSSDGKSSAAMTDATPQAAEVAFSENAAAAHIATLLSNPNSIRDAIILNEILVRPTDRW